MTSVPAVHGRLWGAFGALVLVASLGAGAAPVTAETTVPSTSVPVVADASSTTSTSSTSTSTTTTSTTTTLPSAVTTVPEGCSLPPTAQAVFTGTVTAVDPVTATFTVVGVRAGSLEGYADGGTVAVRYGADVKFLSVGVDYIVGVALDPVTQQLSSTVRDSADLFGGNEVVGGAADCPEFEAVARTLNLDGTSIESGVFSNFLGDPLRLLAALVLPFVLVLVALLAAVWVRRGLRR